MQRTALPRSCYEYYREELSLSPFLKFGVRQKLCVVLCDDTASFVHRVNDGWIYSGLDRSVQDSCPSLVLRLGVAELRSRGVGIEKQRIFWSRLPAKFLPK